jgi:hypothetical protein
MAEGGTNLGTATGYIEIRDNISTATQNAQRASQPSSTFR